MLLVIVVQYCPVPVKVSVLDNQIGKQSATI